MGRDGQVCVHGNGLGTTGGPVGPARGWDTPTWLGLPTALSLPPGPSPPRSPSLASCGKVRWSLSKSMWKSYFVCLSSILFWFAFVVVACAV